MDGVLKPEDRSGMAHLGKAARFVCLLCGVTIISPALCVERNKTFFCEQFFLDIRNRTGFEFTVNDSSPPGTVLARFQPPAADEDGVYMTSDDADYVNFKDYALTVQKSLRPKNGETLYLAGTCVGLFEDYNFTADFHLTYLVHVVDVNDPPVFVNLPANIEIYENMTLGSLVYTVKVDDSRDKNERFKTKYIGIDQVTGLETTRPSPARTFLMTDSGHIRLVEPLDYEQGPRIYKLVVAAKDGGNPPATNYSRLVIRVLDVDDMPPKFAEDFYTAKVVGEKPLLGKEECFNTTPRILAEDLDRHLKSEIRYDIIDGDPGTRDYWGQYFRIEPSTGMLCQLQMVQRLLRNAITGRDVFFNFTFTIRAYQTDNPQKYDTTELFVEITDDNQYPPKFERKLYRTSLPEYPLTKDGTKVVTVKAVDKDFGLNSEFRYDIKTDPSGAFSVNSETGDVTITHSHLLDRESKEYLEIKIRAKEINTLDKFEDVTRVLVHVLDVNDNPPLFAKSTYRYTIKDTLRQGRPIHLYDERPHAFDSDAGDNGRVEYRIESIRRLGGSDSYTLMADLGRFSVDSETGVINLSGSLRDLRRKREYPEFRLEVTATDRALRKAERLSSTTEVYIAIEPANDHPPTFTPSGGLTGRTSQYTDGRYHVSEDAPIGTLVANAKAFDDDGDEDVFLRYWISAGDEQRLFRVTSDGQIVLGRSLDREASNFHKLVLSVTDGQHNASTHIGVFVDDVNDNEPRFEADEYEFMIPEHSVVGTVVGRVAATDVDLGDGGDVVYDVKSGHYDDIFDVDKAGIIKVKRRSDKLDRESTESVHLKIVASDRGEPPLKSAVDVIVHLSDVNDHVPVFSRPAYYGSVDESGPGSAPGRVILETAINATDADATDDNRNIRYRLNGDGSDLFRIGPRDARVEVKEHVILDAETKRQYHMQVIATDCNDTGMSGYAGLIITVNDMNDNTPYFTSNSRFIVKASAPVGAAVGHVTAKDDDITETNNRVIYLLRSGGFGKFSVDFETGNITIADVLDREPHIGTYRLYIDVLDGGLPRRKNTTLVTVSVPINRRPIISGNSTRIAVDENVPVGTVVGKIDARDPEGDSASLRYMKDKASRVPFAVDETSGHVTTSSSLDYESEAAYEFVVHVIDGGDPPMTSSATVSVRVNDVNDVAPRFLLPRYEGVINEDDGAPDVAQLVNMAVNITTVDDDSAAGFRRADLSLRGEHSDYFYIDSDTDAVRVSSRGAGRIDREKQERFNLVLRATDKDNPELFSETEYVIHVRDTNDNGPVFVAPPGELLVRESARVGDVIGRVVANDSDATSPNNEVLYLMENDPLGKFRLDIKTGEISILSGLFYEPRQPTYNITITAIDLGTPRKQAQITVTVRVLKRHFSDFRPEFLGETIFHTPEEVPVGTVVGTIKFTEQGLSSSETVHLNIESGSPVPFAIESRTGEIRTTGRLDSDHGPSWYKFKVHATDITNPQHKAKTTIGIILQDINDNPPRFTRYEYRHRVADTFPPDTIVATPFAYDNIDSDQSVYNYTLHGAGAGKYFVIDPESGVVRTTEALGELQEDTVEYGLIAEDLHQRSLVALARLVIDVTHTGKPSPCLPAPVDDHSLV